ncbi:cell division protein ZapA [Variovorax sp. RHLX14]|uniref:cell division protein ZapA n=1 Tax=Variovorax sp. RHLX14 TaxID=1259731 RepID=UPI003F464C31
MKQIEVQIMDQNYLLGCPEGGEAELREAVERVDTAMCKIRDAGKVRARDRIAVLASLNLAYDLGQQVAATSAALITMAVAAAEKSESADDSANGDASHPDTDEARAAQLVQRLDQALAGDSHLL